MNHSIELFAKPIFTVIVLICLSAFAFAQKTQSNDDSEVKFPDTPAGKTVSEFFKAFNSGKKETMKKFHEDFGGNPENADKDMDAYEQTGGLKLSQIVRSENYELEVIVEAKNGGKLSFTFTVSEQTPHALTSIRAQPAS